MIHQLKRTLLEGASDMFECGGRTGERIKVGLDSNRWSWKNPMAGQTGKEESPVVANALK
tara:strand:+ start:2584 stop:2763 length:180 start_codon:yes stop_codon:yes gene_type:complete